jgi:hypothetical protein
VKANRRVVNKRNCDTYVPTARAARQLQRTTTVYLASSRGIRHYSGPVSCATSLYKHGRRDPPGAFRLNGVTQQIDVYHPHSCPFAVVIRELRGAMVFLPTVLDGDAKMWLSLLPLLAFPTSSILSFVFSPFLT